jgi:acyl-CoA thioester hydrolase
MQTYSGSFEVQPGDIDMLGHLSNLVVAKWAQDIAIAHSEHVGFDITAYRSLGGMFVLRTHTIEYLRSAYLSDIVVASTGLVNARGASCSRVTTFQLGDHLVAKSTTLWVFVDMTSLRAIRIPDPVRRAFGYP